MNQDNETTTFHQYKFDNFTFNVNREKHELNLLTEFAEMIPICDENGPRIEVGTKPVKIVQPNKDYDDNEQNETDYFKSVYMNLSVASRMRIPGSNKLNDEEYFAAFVEKRKEIAKHIVLKTYSQGYETPSSVQMLSIVELLMGRDCMIQAKSGTGKTYSFLSGIGWNFDPNDPTLQHLYITNTHEVATQIHEWAVKIYPEANIELCIGQKKETGSNPTGGGFKQTVRTSALNTNSRPQTIAEERDKIKNAQVIVGTMGKIYGVICNRRWNNLNSLKAICVDEFDKIITSNSKARNSMIMTTEDQMAEIITSLPETTQRAFFSATVNTDALNIACSYFRPYDNIVGREFIALLNTEDYTLEGIRQYYVPVTSTSDKDNILLDLLKICRITQSIIFVNKKETAYRVKKLLDEQDIPIANDVFHGDMTSNDRRDIYNRLVKTKIRLLVSTDLSSRGIDLQSINIIFNYDMPDELETYIHRVGRSGRYGRKGTSVSFVLNNDRNNEFIKVETIDAHSVANPMELLTMENMKDLS